MNFNRIALLEAVDAAMVAHRARHDALVDEWDSYLREHKAEWLKTWKSPWRAAALDILDRLEAGLVITSDVIPHESKATWSEPYRRVPGNEYARGPGKYVEDIRLRALRTALAAVTDETVSPSGLRSLGVTSATMQAAIQHLAVPAGDIPKAKAS